MLFYMQIDLHLQFNIVWLCSIVMMIFQDNCVIIKLSSHINVCVNINKAIVCTSLKIDAKVRIYMKHHQWNLVFSRAQSAHWFPVSWILGEPTVDDVFAARASASGFQVNLRDFWRINPRICSFMEESIIFDTIYSIARHMHMITGYSPLDLVWKTWFHSCFCDMKISIILSQEFIMVQFSLAQIWV